MSVTLSNKLYVYMYPIPSGFQADLFHCTDEQHVKSSQE
jgi:hypothetical protein